MSLDSVVYGFLDGESPETIRDNFPALSLRRTFRASREHASSGRGSTSASPVTPRFLADADLKRAIG